MDFSNYKESLVKNSKSAGSGVPALSLTHTVNTNRFVLNRSLLEKMGLGGKTEDVSKVKFQIIIVKDKLFLSEEFFADEPFLSGTIKNGVVTFYTTELATNIEKIVGCSLEFNKTWRFDRVEFVTDNAGNDVAQISLKI